MDLRTVKHFIWKSGGDLTLHYRQKSTWKSQFLKRDLSSFANHHPPLTCSTRKPHCEVQSCSINENPVKFVRTWLTVYHRELTRTGRSSQETPGKRVVRSVSFLFLFSFLQFDKNQENGLFSPALTNIFVFFFFFSLTAMFILSFRLASLFWSDWSYSTCSCPRVCVCAHGCSRLFVCSSTFQKLSLFYKHSTPVSAVSPV